MLKRALGSLSLLLVLATDCLAGDRPPPDPATKTLFVTNCAPCHGETGDGEGVTQLDRTARSFLEEAMVKWPGDTRFNKPMAMIYATFGQGVLAVRSLERHLADHKDDLEGLFTGVEWIYQLRLAGAVAHSPADDLKLAKGYADAYAKAKGPQAALVKQWVDFLEKKL